MTAFDLVVRGGTVVDGTGAPARPADVGVLGDRILAVGDLGALGPGQAALELDATGRIVSPGFIDIHGHSDASVLVDGALASHLRQGFTTQLSGNCGLTLAPLDPGSLEHLAGELEAHALAPRWRSFPEYLDVVDAVQLGPNVAFLAGHGTIRGSVVGPDGREATPEELARMVAEVETALEAGAFGLSSGLIYAPGLHASTDELARLAAVAARRGGLYATHIRNESAGLFDALDEAIATIRAAGDGARLQVSHLKAGAKAVWGRAGDAIARLEAARADGLNVAADQYPYVAAATDLAVILPPGLLGLTVDEVVVALADDDMRARIQHEIRLGRTGWENVAADPGWEAIRIAWSPSRPDWSGRSIAELADAHGHDPAELAFDILAQDRLATAVVLDCASEPDIEAILAVPWIAICTDAEGRRPGHAILDAGVPHPRTYGTTARILGHYVRDRRTLSIESAIAKLTSVPAERIGLRDRGVIRESAFADLVILDPGSVADTATDARPASFPAGIEHVFVNGMAAVLHGRETGDRPGRLLRRAS
jgi:N-acyl-D-aspartate/D-glutamate deacylase